MNKVKLIVGALIIGAVINVQAQVTGNVPVSLNADQLAMVQSAVAVYNAENNTNLTALQWASLVATKAVVAEAQETNRRAALSVRQYWSELTEAERTALMARIAEIKAARIEQQQQ